MSSIIKDRQRILEAMDLLANAFSWPSTKEGFAYWAVVMRNLNVLANGYTPTYKIPRHPPNKQQCHNIRLNIEKGFSWCNTEQGIKYWSDVCVSLQRMAGPKFPYNGEQQNNNSDPISDYDRAMSVL